MIQFLTPTHSHKQTKERMLVAWDLLLQRRDLGFWQLPEREESWRISQSFAKGLGDKSEHLVVIGLGGSALGGKCLVESVGQPGRVSFLYNTDPLTVDKLLNDENHIRHSHFLFISKSGRTLELACLLDILTRRLQEADRPLEEAVSVVTEEKTSPLYDWAYENKVKLVPHPLDVGGRFSALSPVGLIPSAYAGVPLDELRKGAQQALGDVALVTELSSFYYDSFSRGEFLSVFWFYVDRLMAFAPWLIQLWAESLAKKVTRGGGAAPRVSTPIAYFGTCDQHSVLQQLMEGSPEKSVCFFRCAAWAKIGESLMSGGLPGFEYLQGKKLGEVFQTQSVSTQEALREAGCSTASLELENLDAQVLGRLMMTFELVIGVLGESLDINAFDQPGVELGKKITTEKLQKSSRV